MAYKLIKRFSKNHKKIQYLLPRILDPRRNTIDHWQPRSKGGADKPTNWIAICKDCNCKKGNGDILPKIDIAMQLKVHRKNPEVAEYFKNLDLQAVISQAKRHVDRKSPRKRPSPNNH